MKKLILLILTIITLSAYSQVNTVKNFSNGLIVDGKATFNYDATVTGVLTADSTLIADSLSVISDANFGGNVTITGDLLYNYTHLYADFTGTYTPDVTGGNYLKVTPVFTVGEADNITFAGDTATVTTVGDYFIMVNIGYYGGSNDIYSFAIFKDNSLDRAVSFGGDGTSNPSNAMVMHYFANCAVGTDFSIRIANTVDNDDPTITSIAIFIDKKPE